MKLRFRNATVRDIPLLRNLAQASWQTAYAEILSAGQICYMLENMYSEAALKADFENSNYRYFILEAEEKSVGFMGFEYNFLPGTTKLHRLYLLEEERGKKIGENALKFLKDKAVQAGQKRLVLNVNKNNPARQFYERQGFAVFDEGIFDIGNGYVMDDYLMELKF